jgi:hypothetical protein
MDLRRSLAYISSTPGMPNLKRRSA